MKIIGGNFGVQGSAFISRDHKLVIEGARKAAYAPDQVISVSANQSKERKFGLLGFIVGAVGLSVILGIIFNIVGVVIAIAIAAAGSFYTESSNVVEVRFTDSKAVTLECTPRGVRKLVAFAPL